MMREDLLHHVKGMRLHECMWHSRNVDAPTISMGPGEYKRANMACHGNGLPVCCKDVNVPHLQEASDFVSRRVGVGWRQSLSARPAFVAQLTARPRMQYARQTASSERYGSLPKHAGALGGEQLTERSCRGGRATTVTQRRNGGARSAEAVGASECVEQFVALGRRADFVKRHE